MALEQIKTQVLLLHSQQSTLDTLSAGFGDRYAVHMATSGAEALTTLGETPIHIIISAQDLPGMSGLEALREARKRSPDTVGILLAGEDGDDGLEALVSDQEVFQIVRGAVTPEALLELVESATKRVRLLALSESANDTAANVDEPVSEHIIMETSDNGANIISDGTARLRALRSRQPRIASNAGGSDVDVLVLTKDEEFLATIMESSRELHSVHHANTAAQAEEFARNHKVGVLVTDAAMAASDIESITERLRKSIPRLVAIVAGRRDDGELLMDLINRGQVYRFLLKPVSPGRARLAIEASVKRHLEAADSAFDNRSRQGPGALKPFKKVQPVAPRSTAAARRVEPPPGPGSAPAKASAAAADSDPAKAPPAADPPAEVEDAAVSSEEDPGLSGRFRRTVTDLHDTLRGASDGEESQRSGKPALLAGGGAAVAVIAGLAWWLAKPDVPPVPRESDVTTPTSAPRAEPAPSIVESDVPLTEIQLRVEARDRPAPAPAHQPFLDEAREARNAGEIVAPPGNNAIELYLAALEIAPQEPEIASELAEVIDEAIAVAETALLEGRTADAASVLGVVRLASPDNPRLPFLDAQAAQLQLRAQLDRARAAVRERRLEDAAAALAAAAELGGGEQPELALLQQELATARSEQRVDEVLGLANERLAGGALTVPANDNARYFFELALSNDPENAVARQGLTLVAGKLVLRARDAIDSGALGEAEKMLQDASALDPDSNEVSAAMESLSNALAAAEAARLAEAERQAELDRPTERELEAELYSQAAALTDTDGASGAGTTAVSRQPGGDVERSFAATGPVTATPNRRPEQPSAARGAGGEPAADGPDTVDAGAYVPISSLKRTNYVAPRYPRSAQRRDITGWVNLSFTVTRQGDVANVEIFESSPGDVFDGAATDAVAQWRFEPSIVDGTPVERRVAVRLAFNLE